MHIYLYCIYIKSHLNCLIFFYANPDCISFIYINANNIFFFSFMQTQTLLRATKGLCSPHLYSPSLFALIFFLHLCTLKFMPSLGIPFGVSFFSGLINKPRQRSQQLRISVGLSYTLCFIYAASSLLRLYFGLRIFLSSSQIHKPSQELLRVPAILLCPLLSFPLFFSRYYTFKPARWRRESRQLSGVPGNS